MKMAISIFRRIIFAGFLLYSYNIISVSFNLVIPINYFSILIVALLGPFGLTGIILFKVFIL
jgi:hypothetical protein